MTLANDAPKVIVTGIRYRHSLLVMEHLAKLGFQIIGMDSIPFPLGRFSRYCHQFVTYPLDHQAMVDRITTVAKAEMASYLVPTFNETQVFCQHQLRLYQAGIQTLFPDPDAMALADKKDRLTQLAGELGCRVPESWMPKNLDEIKQIKNQLPYPVIVKPITGKAGEGQYIAENSEELLKGYRSETRYIVQQYVLGYPAGVAMMLDQGVQQVHFSFKVNQCLDGVHSVDREAVELPEAVNQAEKVLAYLHWHGLAQVDFIIEQETGHAYMLEVNPRFWGSLNLALKAGKNFPKFYGQMLLQRPLEAETQRPARTIWFLPWLMAQVKFILGKHTALKFFNPFSTDTFIDEWHWRDPVPMLIEPWLGLAQWLRTGSIRLSKSQPTPTQSRSGGG